MEDKTNKHRIVYNNKNLNVKAGSGIFGAVDDLFDAHIEKPRYLDKVHM